MRQLTLILTLVVAAGALSCSSLRTWYHNQQRKQKMAGMVREAQRYAGTMDQKKALEKFKAKDGEFRDGDLYIFAYTFDGKCLYDAARPEIVGKNVLEMEEDDLARIAFKEFRVQARVDEGWTKVHWPHPEADKILNKECYVMRVNTDWFIGSGVYELPND